MFYQIKRLAYAPNHSPVAGLMSEHIVGFADFMKSSKELKPNKQGWVDLRDQSIEGVTLVDRYTWRIRIHKTYPQFEYWLAMNFSHRWHGKWSVFINSLEWSRATSPLTGTQWVQVLLC